jgi:uncharacterized protein
MADGIEHSGIAMLKNIRTYLTVFLVLACAAPVLAASDPTIAQVYEAARTGHLDQAQQMMSQVLRDHPQSAKAHYVAAEIYAKGGNLARARQELDTAQTLAPGLPFATPESVQGLQEQLTQEQSAPRAPRYSQVHSAFPLRTVLLVVGGVCVLWLIMRRRTPPGGLYSQYPSSVPTTGGPMSYGGPAMGGGMGSGIAGGLASGLAVGAGVVAGEELAHHFLDGNRHEPGMLPPGTDPAAVPDNGGMGGSDFGVSDPSSWEDNSGSIGGDVGGGDDWT